MTIQVSRIAAFGAGLLAGAAIGAPAAAQDRAPQSQGAASGFYLRGDLSAAFSTQASTQDDDCGGGAPYFGCGTSLDSSAGSSLGFTVGGGYRFLPWLRADATLGYRPMFGVDGTVVRPGVIDRPFEADISSVSGMINGYLDIAGLVPGRLGIMQPYVMAGIGLAHNDLGEIATTRAPTGAAETIAGGGNLSFAWTLGVGTGIDMGKGFVIDVGYKYLDLGEFSSDGGVNACSAGSCRYVDSVTGGLSVHEFSAGVRYHF
ncbi:MAG: outer membrane protein [Rhodospirillales bacterium]